MFAYFKSRKNLKKLVYLGLESVALKDGQTLTTSRRRGLNEEADGIINEHEKLTNEHGTWSGAWQGFLGSWLYALSVLALSGFAYAASLDFRTVVTNFYNVLRHPSQQQAAPPAPSPATTP